MKGLGILISVDLKYRRIIAKCWPLRQIAKVLFYNSGVFFYKKLYRSFQYEELFGSLKNSKRGKRCFIIGNGPSLMAQDLEQLKGEDCFGANAIYKIFENTSWRPTYYLVMDRYFDMDPKRLASLDCEIMFLGDYYWRSHEVLRKDAICLHQHFCFGRDRYPVSKDISKKVVTDHTVSFVAMQIAAYLGYTEIYLLGLDHNYPNVYALRKGFIHKEDVAAHFFEDDKPNNLMADVRGMTLAYESFKKYADEHNIIVKNATRGGKLEVFERIEFDKILREGGVFQRFRKNRIIRFIMYPIMNAYEYWMRCKYLKSVDYTYVKRLKNKYKGERCFVIGNGPSLRPDDLEKLIGEKTFGSNKIYCIFPKTKWRPSFYISMDNDHLVTDMSLIKNSGTYPKLLNYKASKYGRKKEDNIWYLCMKNHFFLNPYAICPKTLREDVSKGCTKLGSVTAHAIEVAIYMGFTTIYLLGVDNNYVLKADKDGKIYRDPTVKTSYFEGIQGADGKSMDKVGIQTVDFMNASYKACRKFAERKGVKIYNATRGGKLEIFERVDFDKLFAVKD